MARPLRNGPTNKPVLVRQKSYRASVTTTGPPTLQASRFNSFGGGISNRKRLKPPPSFRPYEETSAVLTGPGRLDLTLPIPPSINHQYATVNGRRILSATGRSYKKQVAQQILLALSKFSHRDQLLNTLRSGYLTLTIRFHFPSLLRRDVDGGLKITQDALCEALGLNDNRILHIHLFKIHDKTFPRTVVSLTGSPLPEVVPTS